MLTIERLVVRAYLDEPSAALERARGEAGAGDESWQQWVAEYQRGEAMIVRLDVTLEANDGQRRAIEISNYGIFIEAHPHPPKVERQIADIVSKDYAMLAAELSKLGHRLHCDELGDMYVHVELGADLREALRGSASGSTPVRGVPPRADVRLSEPGGPD